MKTFLKWTVGIVLGFMLLKVGRILLWPPVYWADEIQGQIVDADTGEPLEGIIITANWELQGPWEDIPEGQMMVMEAVTDKEGRFAFPAWGPKLRRPLVGFGRIKFQDPQLLLFKSGYEYKRLQNALILSTRNKGPHRRSDWNGKTILLKKFTRSLKEYAEHIGDLSDYLQFAFRHDDCSWKQIPRMLVAIHREEKRLQQKGIPTYRSSILDREDRAEWAEPSTCGSVREFLRSYLP
jgi:hypothetical protein